MTSTSGATVFRGAFLRAAALSTLAVTLGVGLSGQKSLEGVRRAAEWVTGQPEPRICPFRAATGFPCMGCFGTRSFADATRGHLGRAFHRNALGAFLGVSAWVLGLASAVTLATGWRRPFLWAWGLVLVLSPAAVLYRAVTWWAALPAAVFQLH